MIYRVFRADQPDSLIEELTDRELPVTAGEKLRVMFEGEEQHLVVTEVDEPHLHENRIVLSVWVEVNPG